jgi:predicted ribosome quality control (RQC) complex YloA/Tae2 family protein
VEAELIASAGRSLARGTAEVEMPNWYDPGGGSIRIELDPLLDGPENAERRFRRYRRGLAAARRAEEQLPALEEERSALLLRRRSLALLSTDALRDELVRLAGRSRDTPATAAAVPTPRPYPAGVRIRSVRVGGHEILWGENAVSNDYLTTRVARPGDLWLHARAVTGAHVVIRNPGPPGRLPPAVLREAARIAAANSDARHAHVAPVDYTYRRHVRRPRGSAPGRVVYTAEKTLDVVDPLRETV